MRLSVRISLSLAALAGLALSFGGPALAQSTAAKISGNGTYIAVDPLANVRYDNRYDISLGAAYDHAKTGPDLLEGANLGGLDLSASYWFSKHWAVEGSGRGYMGNSVAAPNTKGIDGLLVSQYFFAAGPEWLGPHNKHAALIAHALVGGAYGDFQRDLGGTSPSVVDFYNNQVAPAAIFGGHLDLNRTAHWVFRITPDALFTRYNANYSTSTTPSGSRDNWNFGISVGAQYKFSKKR